MRIRIVQSGGFAGLRRERVVETTQLPEAERATLERLVTASGFFALPARAGGAGGARPLPDALQFEVEIEDDAGRRHQVRLPEHATSEALRDLVDRAWNAAGGE